VINEDALIDANGGRCRQMRVIYGN
jgi:hypothetical protein